MLNNSLSMTSHSPTLQGNYGETDAPDSRVVFVLIIFRKKYIIRIGN